MAPEESSLDTEGRGGRTLGELFQLYCQVRALQPDTVRTYRLVCRRFEADQRVRLLEEVTRDRLLGWRNQILRRASPTTWNTYRRHLRALLRYAEEIGWIEENPFSHVPTAPEPWNRKKRVSQTVLARALDTLSREGETLQPRWFWRSVLITFYYTGMRRRQLMHLLWRDYDSRRAALLLVSETSKTRKEWEIPVPRPVQQEFVVLWQEATRVLGAPPSGDRAIFDLPLFRPAPSRRQKYFAKTGLTGEQVSGFFRRLSDELGESITAHRLRHTCASEIAGQPQPDLRGLQQLLGHSSLVTTMQYVEPDLGQLHRLVGGLPDPRGSGGGRRRG